MRPTHHDHWGSTVTTAPVISNEMRADVQCHELFTALQTGDYTSAARAQQRLQELGWDVRRIAASVTQRPASRARVNRQAVTS